ncbi:MAG: aldo/keto reductase [Bacteroidia bacterium]|nr:aldo/keto reductase [Bacteroidia bacterium]
MKPIAIAPDLKVSPIIQGMMKLNEWNLSPAERLKHFRQVADLGVTTFDHADIYGGYTCEELFGEALALEPGFRKQIQLISKCGINLISPNRPTHTIKSYNTTAEHIIWSVEQSLLNLKTDHLDLLLIHRPDPLMNPDETAAAFVHLKKHGKVRQFGVSNFLPRQLMLLQSRLDFPLATNQIQLSLYDLENFDNGSVDFLYQHHIHPMAWAPLAAGRFFSPQDEKAFRIRKAAKTIADRYEVKDLEVIFYAWLFAHPSGIIPITGTSRPDRLQHALKGKQLKLTREEWFELYEATNGKRVP